MSVVNKVLRDLDARHAAASDRVGVPSAVTPLSVHLARKRPLSLLILGGASLAVAAGVSLWILRPGMLSRTPSASTTDTPPQAAPRPLAIAPVSPPVVSPPVAPLPPVAAPEPPAQSAIQMASASTVVGSQKLIQAEPKTVKALPDKLKTTGHFIQIGAFANSGNAMALGEQLRRDIGPLAEKVIVFPSGRLTLVQMGPWSDAADGRRAADTLRDKHGISSAPVLKPQHLPKGMLPAPGMEDELALAALPTIDSPVQEVSSPAAAKPPQLHSPATPANTETSAPVPQPFQTTAQTAARVKNTKTTQSPNDGHIDKQSRLPTVAERAEATYRRGILIHRQGQLEDAAALFRAALEDNPEHAAARQSLAGLLIDSKRFDEAEAILLKGVDLGSVRLPSVLALSRLKVERNQVPAALDLLQQNADVGEQSADYQGFMGALLNRVGRHREASDRYQAASRLAPNEGRWWAALGIALEAQGRSAEAREAYLKARNLPGLPTELEHHIEQRLR